MAYSIAHYGVVLLLQYNESPLESSHKRVSIPSVVRANVCVTISWREFPCLLGTCDWPAVSQFILWVCKVNSLPGWIFTQLQGQLCCSVCAYERFMGLVLSHLPAPSPTLTMLVLLAFPLLLISHHHCLWMCWLLKRHRGRWPRSVWTWEALIRRSKKPAPLGLGLQRQI